MDNEDSFLTRHLFFAVVLGVMLAILGIVVMTSQTTVIATVTGVALIVSGIGTLRSVLTLAVWTGYFRLLTVLKSLICIVLGLWGIMNAQKSFNLVMYLMGAQMAIGGILSIVNAFLLRRDNDQSVGGFLSDGIFSLVIAAFLFVAPQAVGHTLSLVAGLLLVVFGLSLCVWGLKVRKINRDFQKMERQTTASAEVLEEKNVDEE